MKKILSQLFIGAFFYSIVMSQPPVKKLVYKGYRYEYEKEKREGEIILSGTHPYAMTKEYKQFKTDSIKIMQDSLNRKSTKKTEK